MRVISRFPIISIVALLFTFIKPLFPYRSAKMGSFTNRIINLANSSGLLDEVTNPILVLSTYFLGSPFETQIIGFPIAWYSRILVGKPRSKPLTVLIGSKKMSAASAKVATIYVEILGQNKTQN